jgi:hypothetical protein
MREYEDAMLDVKKGMYEYMMSLPWEFERMIHENGNYVVTKDVHYESRLLGNKFKYGINMSGIKPNQ